MGYIKVETLLTVHVLLSMPDTYEEANTHLEPLWTVDQAAAYFNMNRMTIYRWITRGKIKSTKIGNRVRIPRSEIERIAGETKAKLQP